MDKKNIKIGDIEYDIDSEFTKKYTARIKVKGRRKLVLRLRFAGWLISALAFVLGCDTMVSVSFGVKKDEHPPTDEK
jgi:hypothetical protein